MNTRGVGVNESSVKTFSDNIKNGNFIYNFASTKQINYMDNYNYNETEDYLVINLLVKAMLVFGFLYLCNLMN